MSEYQKMSKKVKRAWVKALRSGEYKQGMGHLCQASADGTDRFCCLGVLCDIMIPGNWVHGTSDMADRHEAYSLAPADSPHHDMFGVPSASCEEWNLSMDAHEQLVAMNDYKERSFKQIANWIDKHL